MKIFTNIISFNCMSESDTQSIDEKKNKPSDAPNVDIKPGQFGQFLLNFLYFCLGLIIIWVLGSCVLFQCKVAQSNILPTDINAFPYTDTEPKFGYTKDNHTDEDTIENNYVNIFKFFEGGKEQNMKLFFDYYLTNKDGDYINQDLRFNGRASKIDPKRGWFGMYTTSLFQGVTSFCFSRYSQVFQLMNSVLNETAMLILGPFIMGFAFFVITGLNFIYLFWLYFKNMSWFFMDKVDTPSNDGGEGASEGVVNIDGLLDFRKKDPVEVEVRDLKNDSKDGEINNMGKNAASTKESYVKVSGADENGADLPPKDKAKHAKWKTNYGFSGMLCVFLNLCGLWFGIYPIIFYILSVYTSLSCWVTTLMYSCKIKDDPSQETIGFGSILIKNLLYQIPTFAILFMLWLPQASWKTLGPYGLVCSIIVILMLLFGALFYKSDDKTLDGKKTEQSYNLKDIFKTIPQKPFSVYSNYEPISREYEDTDWDAGDFSEGQSWADWFIETWNYLNGKKANGKNADDNVKSVVQTPDGTIKITTVGEINKLENTDENKVYLNQLKTDYEKKLVDDSNKKGQINIIKKEEYNSIITAANGALEKFNKTGSGEPSAPAPVDVKPPSNLSAEAISGKISSENGPTNTDNMPSGGGGSVKEFDRAIRRLKRVLKGI